MAIPSVKIHSVTPGVKQPGSHGSNGPSRRVDVTIPHAGYQALFDGFIAWGQGIRAFGQAMGQANQRVEGLQAHNAMEQIKAEAEGRDAYLVDAGRGWMGN